MRVFVDWGLPGFHCYVYLPDLKRYKCPKKSTQDNELDLVREIPCICGLYSFSFPISTPWWCQGSKQVWGFWHASKIYYSCRSEGILINVSVSFENLRDLVATAKFNSIFSTQPASFYLKISNLQDELRNINKYFVRRFAWSVIKADCAQTVKQNLFTKRFSQTPTYRQLNIEERL